MALKYPSGKEAVSSSSLVTIKSFEYLVTNNEAERKASRKTCSGSASLTSTVTVSESSTAGSPNTRRPVCPSIASINSIAGRPSSRMVTRRPAKAATVTNNRIIQIYFRFFISVDLRFHNIPPPRSASVPVHLQTRAFALLYIASAHSYFP